MVLSASCGICLALYCSRAVVVGKVFGFATSSSNFLLSGRLVEVDPVSWFKSSLFINLGARSVEVVSVHALVLLGLALRFSC